MPRTLVSVIALSLLAPAALAGPPNVVMIVGDDQGWKDYGFMGGTHVRTPNLDRLAAEGFVYPRGYVPSSLCRASLATMITGLYPHQHKITSNDPPVAADGKRGPEFQKLRNEMVAEFDKSPNLPKLLAAAGYVSHQSGKWWEGDACRCGFTAAMTTGDPAKNGRHGDEGLVIGRQGLKPVTEFIDKAKSDGKPFYVWYAPMMPHQPHTPPDRLLNKYKDKTQSLHVAKYWAMCEWFDETVGDLVGHLDKQGLRENTLVVYLHDNGWIQNPDQPRFAAKSKQSPYDGGTRTPIILRWPGTIAPGRSDALASSIDIAPTVLTATGLKPTPDMPGLDLRKPEALAARGEVLGEIFTHNAKDIRNPAANLSYRWVIRGNWKLIVPNPTNEPDKKAELYNLAADPDETRDLAGSSSARVAELTKRLDSWWPGK